MKKNVLFTLFLLSLVNCNTIADSRDFEEDAINTLANRGIFNDSESELLSENTIMDFTIQPWYQPENGGCTFRKYTETGSYMSTEAFGPNPITMQGHVFRGYGKPFVNVHYKGMIFMVENIPGLIKSPRTGITSTVDNPVEQAISIEQNFEANYSYEITLKMWTTDRIYETKNNRDTGDDDYYDIGRSESTPDLEVELVDVPKIFGTDPCAERPKLGMRIGVNSIAKKQKMERPLSISYLQTYTFNFSPTQNMKALQIYFIPEKSGERPALFVPTSYYRIILNNIKIIKKPFDPSHVVVQPTRPPTSTCGQRGGTC